MKTYTIYQDGIALRTFTGSVENLTLNVKEGELVYEGFVDGLTHYFVDGVPTAKPPQPFEEAVWSGGVWIDPRSPEEIAALEEAATIAEARTYLSDTDWYVTRLIETGKPIPDEVLAKREQARIDASV